MKKIFMLLLGLTTLTLAACVTPPRQHFQRLTINTTPNGAYCLLHNDLGSWQIDSTPATINVMRSPMDLHISCRKNGYGIHIVAVKALATARPLYPSTIIIPLRPMGKTLHQHNQSSSSQQVIAASTNTGYDATMAKQ